LPREIENVTRRDVKIERHHFDPLAAPTGGEDFGALFFRERLPRLPQSVIYSLRVSRLRVDDGDPTLVKLLAP
jgi:hypothetical protein